MLLVGLLLGGLYGEALVMRFSSFLASISAFKPMYVVLNFSLPFLPLIVISFNVRILYSIRRSLCITRIEIKESVIYTAERDRD